MGEETTTGSDRQNYLYLLIRRRGQQTGGLIYHPLDKQTDRLKASLTDRAAVDQKASLTFQTATAQIRQQHFEMGTVCQMCWLANNDGDISCMLSHSPCVHPSHNRCHRFNVSTVHSNENKLFTLGLAIQGSIKKFYSGFRDLRNLNQFINGCNLS